MDSRRSGRYSGKPESKLILIGVQARTDSTRLPGKVNLEIAGKTVLEHVMDSCDQASSYLNRNFNRYQCIVRVNCLIPNADPLMIRYGNKYPIQSFPGVEDDDVLSRYVQAADESRADYVIRITADCVFTAPYLISRCAKAALISKHDYVSNVQIRTFREGMDVEVISAPLLEWLNETAKSKEDREHVTTLLRNRKLVPRKFRFCHVLNDVDDSYIKTSIDTQDDLNRAIAEFDSLNSKRRQALSNGDTVS